MIIHHVTVFHPGQPPETVEVSMAPNSSVQMILMQARSQGLDFHLEESDVLLNRKLLPAKEYSTARPRSACLVWIQPRRNIIRI